MVLLSKLFNFLTGFTSKIAAMFGLKSFIGVSGGTIVSAISIILFCLICGQLVRLRLFRSVSNWVDEKMAANIPGYSIYREMALSKLKEKEEALPYQCALWLTVEKTWKPGFLVETMTDGRLVVFIPTAGNVKEGEVLIVSPDDVKQSPQADMRKFRLAISNLGIGLSEF
jgi:uncharacterized membrane protein